MSKGSAIISILIAFVGGLAIGHLTGGGGDGEEVADIDGEGDGDTVGSAGEQTAEGGDGTDTERFRVPVSAEQPSKGPADALVTIVEFSEFQCPFCTRVSPTISQIMNDYRGKVRFVWRNNPLPFHGDAKPAAELAMEAFAQGGNDKFWQAHDLLFENQLALTRPDLDRYAQQIGLDMNRYRAAMDGHTHMARIEADMALAARLGARGTPGFLINGRLLMGAQPIEQFKEIIDDEVRRAEALIATGIPRARVYAELTKNGRTHAAPEAPAPAGAVARPAPRRAAPRADHRVPVGNSPTKGPDDALVTIIEFSEFECPFCSRVGPTLQQIATDYGRDVRIVFKHNPLPFHQNAGPAAQASMEAYAQGGDAK